MTVLYYFLATFIQIGQTRYDVLIIVLVGRFFTFGQIQPNCFPV